MNLMQNLSRMLGAWGLAGVALLMACATFYAGVLKPAERSLQERQTAIKTFTARAPLQRSEYDARVDNVQRFHAMFPPVQNLNTEVEKLWRMATQYKLDFQSAEYRLESSGPGLIRYRVTLPVRATYAQLRLFVDAILKTIPTASIDNLRFERKKVSETQLDAQIRLTFYFRPNAATSAQH